MTLVLASGSAVRAMLLRNAGLDFAVRPSRVDEDAVKHRFRAEGRSAAELALALGEAKALDQAQGDDLVLGCDQVLECEGELFDKPADLAGARRHLQRLRARPHRLVGGIALVRGADVLWRYVESAELVMRDFSDAFLDDYIAKVGQPLCSSVGAYQLEGMGLQLFDRIDGDYFTILGLPLLPLLAQLRQLGAVKS